MKHLHVIRVHGKKHITRKVGKRKKVKTRRVRVRERDPQKGSRWTVLGIV